MDKPNLATTTNTTPEQALYSVNLLEKVSRLRQEARTLSEQDEEFTFTCAAKRPACVVLPSWVYIRSVTLRLIHDYLIVVLALVAGSCCPTVVGSSDEKQRDARYPDHWWQAVPHEGAPTWEILPQEAGPGEVILSKRNELGLLSNFAATPFTFRNKRYASLEGFWQMMLYPETEGDPRAKFPGLHWAYTRDRVSQLTSFEAKKAGTLAEANMKQMGITWVTFEGEQIEYRSASPEKHYRLIVEATWEKVRENPEVKRVLLATGNLILKPDHHQESNAPPEWRYYEILTQIRSQLQSEK